MSNTFNNTLMVGCSSHLAYERWEGQITDVQLYNYYMNVSTVTTTAPS